MLENRPDTLFVNLYYGGLAGSPWAVSPFFIDYKSYTMVPGVAAPKDFLKVLL